MNQKPCAYYHGFNDANPTEDYVVTEKKILSQVKKDIIFLEVYWDGLTANQGNPGFEKIWGPAQLNSTRSAVTMRKLISKINFDFKVRVISHSLGASVATGALFNTISKWRHPEDLEKYYNCVQNIDAPKNPDIRLGMLAPAIPGLTTFEDFNKRLKRNLPIDPSENNINKVVVCYNCNDYATTKDIYKIRLLADKAGSTSLGCNFKGEVVNTKNKMDTSNPGVMETVSFSEKLCTNTIWAPKTEEHGLYYYVINQAKFIQFVDYLFN